MYSWNSLLKRSVWSPLVPTKNRPFKVNFFAKFFLSFLLILFFRKILCLFKTPVFMFSPFFKSLMNRYTTCWCCRNICILHFPFGTFYLMDTLFQPCRHTLPSGLAALDSYSCVLVKYFVQCINIFLGRSAHLLMLFAAVVLTALLCKKGKSRHSRWWYFYWTNYFDFLPWIFDLWSKN